MTVGSKSSVLKKLLPDIGEDQRYDLLDDDEFEGLCERLDGAWLLTIGEITKLTIGSVGFAANELKREDDRWPQVAGAVQSHLEQDPPVPPKVEDPPVGSEKVVPRTELRHFYRSLRLLNAKDIHDTICGYLAGRNRGTKLGDMFLRSVHHFQQYDNSSEPFHGRIDDAPVPLTGNYAFDLVAKIADPNVHVNFEDPSLAGEFVDRELSPFRSTSRTGPWRFENGESGRISGAGGLDLLLMMPDGRPVIGEVKAEGDSTLFFALVQSLMYAAELVTSNQMKRLDHAYGGRIKLEVPGTADVILFCEKKPDGMDLVQKISGAER
ncbi:MAG TPA: hypothetical protein EYG03_10880 [Planctomycetes bacterium]|nr:hypothetical protein [Planctomycetota bacterium]